MKNFISSILFFWLLIPFLLLNCTRHIFHFGTFESINSNDKLVLTLKENNKYECEVDHHLLGKGKFNGKFTTKSDTLLLQIPNDSVGVFKVTEMIVDTLLEKKILVIQSVDQIPMAGVFIKINDDLNLVTQEDGSTTFQTSKINQVNLSYPSFLNNDLIYKTNNEHTNFLLIEIPIKGKSSIKLIQEKWIFHKGKLFSIESSKNSMAKENRFFLKRRSN